MDIIQQLERAEIAQMPEKRIDDFRPGDTIKVHCNVVEGAKRRIQIFEGIVMFRKGTGLSESFCVRKISAGGIGVERVFPLHSPTVAEITRVRQGRVRRARLFYLRDRVGKSARVREKTLFAKTETEDKTPRRKGRKARKAEATEQAGAE